GRLRQVASTRQAGDLIAEGRQVAELTARVIDRDVGVLTVDKGHLDQPFQRRIPSGPRLGFLDRSDLALCLFEAGGYLRAKDTTKVAVGVVPPVKDQAARTYWLTVPETVLNSAATSSTELKVIRST